MPAHAADRAIQWRLRWGCGCVGRRPSRPSGKLPLRAVPWSRPSLQRVAEGSGGNARSAAVISSPNLGVLAVAAAGVLCAFCCVVDTLPEQCLCRGPRANPLVAAVLRTKRLLREHCSATCPRRRLPGQVRHTQGGLQITAVKCSSGNIGTRQLRHARTDDLRGPVYPALPSFSWRLSWLRGTAPDVHCQGWQRVPRGRVAHWLHRGAARIAGRCVPGRQRRQVRRPSFTQTRTSRPLRAAGSRASPGRSR
jgi:hypothetical protein